MRLPVVLLGDIGDASFEPAKRVRRMPKEIAVLYGPSNGARTRNLRMYRQLPVNLHRTRETFAQLFRETLQKYRLTDPQWRVLRILSTTHQMESADLARRAMLLGPSVSRIVRDLRRRKLLVTTTSKTDARRVWHSITPAAGQLIDRVIPEFAPVYERLARHFSDGEVATLNALLERVCEALRSPAGK